MKSKTLGLIGFVSTLIIVVMSLSSCDKDKNLKKGNQIDFRDSIVGMYACTTRSHLHGSYPDSTGTFVPIDKTTIDSVHLDTFIVTKAFLVNTISMDGKTFTADSFSHELFNSNPPPTPALLNSVIQFSIKDKYINYSYVKNYKFTRIDEYRYGSFIGN